MHSYKGGCCSHYRCLQQKMSCENSYVYSWLWIELFLFVAQKLSHCFQPSLVGFWIFLQPVFKTSKKFAQPQNLPENLPKKSKKHRFSVKKSFKKQLKRFTNNKPACKMPKMPCETE